MKRHEAGAAAAGRWAPQYPTPPRRWRRIALAAAAAACAGLVQAQPAQPLWRVEAFGELNSVATGMASNGAIAVRTQLGGAVFNPDGSTTYLGQYLGQNVYVSAVNARGQVAGHVLGTSGMLGFVYEGGVFTPLDHTLSLEPRAINNAGVIAGTDYSRIGDSRAFVWTSNGVADVGLAYADGNAINASGHVAGSFVAADGALRPFVFDGTSSTIGATPGGSGGGALALNDRGDIAGWYGPSWDRRGFAHVGGALVTPFPSTPSEAQAINSHGAFVGWVAQGVDTRGYLHSGGRTTFLDGVNGLAGRGWTVDNATAINDRGQIAVTLRSAGGTEAARLTLVRNVWASPYDGSWDDASAWSHGLLPSAYAHTVLDPSGARQVLGPAGAVAVKRLSVGGGPGGGGGQATLRLNGGTITVLEDVSEAGVSNRGAYISARGVLTGDGRIVIEPGFQHALWNDGTVVAADVRVDGALVNNGLVSGAFGTPGNTPRVQASFLNNSGAIQSGTGVAGVMRVLRGEQLLTEGLLRNVGDIQVFGGSYTHRGGAYTVSITAPGQGQDVGRILGQDARLEFRNGLVIDGGQLLLSAGNSNVFGRVDVQRSSYDSRGGQIVVTGRSQATFYDTLDVGAGSELRISSGSVATFLGAVRQRTGALFTGTGTKFYEGGLAVGSSPGIGTDEGDVIFAGSNLYEAEIGGTTPGSGHDKLIVQGLLAFGGTLQLVSWQGYSGQIGDRYDLFDWGTTEGQFDLIDSSGFLLADGALLDFSRLYVDGTVAVVAVPEPGTWGLWIAGLGAMGFIVRRQRR